MPPPRRFSPGFRISILDGAFILGGLATAALARKEIAIPSVVAVGHFFLFCNVFRIPRQPELIWAATYIGLVSSTLVFDRPSWPLSTALAMTLAGSLIWRATRRPDYHGVGWRTINPGLPDWWAGQPGP